MSVRSRAQHRAQQRMEVEEVMRQAFGWGWDNAKSWPGDAEPELNIRWDENGNPVIYLSRPLAPT